MDIVKLTGDNYVIYHPKWRKKLKSITACILLQKVVYWFNKTNKKAFFKFREACNHEDYRAGDSWYEELGFSRKEFDSALKAIAQKLRKGIEKDENVFVYYWVTSDRKTYYEVNENAFEEFINDLYSKSNKKEEPTVQKEQYVMSEKGSTKSEKGTLGSVQKEQYVMSKRDSTYNTKKTTKVTTKNKEKHACEEMKKIKIPHIEAVEKMKTYFEQYPAQLNMMLSTAKFKASEERVAEEILKYCSKHSENTFLLSDLGKLIKGFHYWLVNAKNFDRKAPQDRRIPHSAPAVKADFVLPAKYRQR